jgi:photosystem II stability/assembly factor-like uncharacterized protein
MNASFMRRIVAARPTIGRWLGLAGAAVLTALLLAGCGGGGGGGGTPAPVATITAQPVDTQVQSESSATFSVGAPGAKSYQWQLHPAGSTPDEWSDIPGANGPEYTLQAVDADNGSQYRVIVGWSGAASLTSSIAKLTVSPEPVAPTITLQPTSTGWRPGVVPAYFLAGVDGSGVSLQWQTSRDRGMTWVDAAGATSTSFVLSALGDGTVSQVRLAATNGAGTFYSTVASLSPTYWAPVTNTLTSSHLVSVRWIGPTTVLAVGDGNTMLRSTDSGATWAITAQIAQGNARALAIRGQTAIALSAAQAIVRSVDGGAHWFVNGSLPDAPSDSTYYTDLAFSDTAVIAVGNAGNIQRSTDGGVTWLTVGSGATTVDLRGVAFNSAGVGIAVGARVVLRSTDGGATWTNAAATMSYLWDVAFVDASTVIAVGDDGLVLRSTDAGQTWQTVATGSTLPLQQVAFDAAGNGMAAGQYQNQRLHSTDGGLTWTALSGPTQVEAIAYAPVVSAATAVAVGQGGAIETSTDGGATWVSRTPGNHHAVRGIAFASPAIGVAVGEAGTILRSINGGDSWTAISAPSTAVAMWDVAFATSQVGVAVGDSGTIWRSADAGATWSAVLSTFGEPLKAVRFTSATHGVAVGSDSIEVTNDAGLTWHAASTGGFWPTVQSVAFGTSMVGVSVGDGLAPGVVGNPSGAVRRTTDGGETWSDIPLPYPIWLRSVSFADANTVLAVGTDINELRSTDAGLTWVAIPQHIDFESVHFTSASEGYAIAISGGYFTRTHDGGLTWSDLELVTGDELPGTVVSPAGKTFVTTYGGAIYRNDAP